MLQYLFKIWVQHWERIINRSCTNIRCFCRFGHSGCSMSSCFQGSDGSRVHLRGCQQSHWTQKVPRSPTCTRHRRPCSIRPSNGQHTHCQGCTGCSCWTSGTPWCQHPWCQRSWRCGRAPRSGGSRCSSPCSWPSPSSGCRRRRRCGHRTGRSSRRGRRNPWHRGELQLSNSCLLQQVCRRLGQLRQQREMFSF